MEEQSSSTETISNQTTTKTAHVPFLFLAITTILIGVFIFGLRWIFTISSQDVGSVPFLLFDYAVGLTMIFLPCTLPLAFVIVPLVMGKSYQKGIGIALAFGLGVTITLSFYGALIGLLGQTLGIHQVETAKNILYALAGTLAILFALGELNLIKFKAPTYTGGAPRFILQQKDISKAFLLGLFLGNVGVGCPNPLFNAVIIPQIVVTASPFQGWLIMVVQALGRITPLFILAFLAILGINATAFLVRHKDTVTRFTAWSTIFIGGFLLTLGLFGHDWWVISGMHTALEMVTQENFITNLLGSKIGELGHAHEIPAGIGLFGTPSSWGIVFILMIWTLPMAWYYLWKKENIQNLPVEQQAFERRYTHLVGWFFCVTALLLIVVFGYYLPHMFAAHWSRMGEHEEKEDIHKESTIMKKKVEKDFHVTLSSIPDKPTPGKPFDLKIALHDSKRNPITDLQISHERILHVILVSEDLEEFKHVHPEDAGRVNPDSIQKGEFVIPLTLSKTDRYRVLADASRKGIGEVSDTTWLSVEGKTEPILLKVDYKRSKTFGDYTVRFNTSPSNLSPLAAHTPLKAGEETELIYVISKQGKPVLDIEQYLGADMHLVIMSVDLSTIVHTHGVKIGGETPYVQASYTFPFPGLWKIYGQFQHKGKVVTTEFMIEVAPGETINTQQETAPHTH